MISLGKICGTICLALAVPSGIVGVKQNFETISQAKIISSYQDSISVLKVELKEFKFDIDSVRNIAKIDTAAIYKRGYEQAKLDKACSYVYQSAGVLITMGKGECKYWFNIEKKSETVSGGGQIKDASIHIK